MQSRYSPLRPLPGALIVSSLLLASGAQGQTLLGQRTGPSLDLAYGQGIDYIGDIDGDGVDDYLIGSPQIKRSLTFPPSPAAPGYATVYSGATGTALFPAYVGALATDMAGYEVAGLGDTDGDLVPDFAIASPQLTLPPAPVPAPVGTGVVRVYSGATGALLSTTSGYFAGDDYGFAMAGGADFNNDGYGDLLVGAPGLSGQNYGYAEILLLGPGGTVQRQTFRGAGTGANQDSQFGFSVAIGELTGDGVPDVAVGAPGEWLQGISVSTGSAYAFQYNSSASLPSSIYHALGTDVPGFSQFDQFGAAVAIIGDTTGDGYGELLVGAPGFGSGFNMPAPDTGLVCMFSDCAGSCAPSTMQTRLQLLGPSAGSKFGAQLVDLGFLETDPLPQPHFAVSAPGASTVWCMNGFAYTGWPLVGFLSVNSPYALKVLFSGVDPSITSTLPGFGTSLASGGDQNCDGYLDLLVSGPGTAPLTPVGRVDMYSVSQAPLGSANDVHSVSVSSGGTQLFELNAGSGHAGDTYLMLGSISGINPGTTMGMSCGVLPLNPDVYFNLSLYSPAATPLVGSVGQLDGSGQAEGQVVAGSVIGPAFDIPAGVWSAWAGTQVHHAYVVISSPSGAVNFASNALSVTLVP